MTKKDLQEYYWVRKNIKQLEEKLLELETQAMKMTTRITHEINSSSGQQDKLGNIVAKIVELKDEINSKIEKSYSLIKKVEKAIEKLPEREKYLVRARYIDCRSWEQIAVDMNYSWRQVHYIHSNALKLLASENFADHCTQLHTGT